MLKSASNTTLAHGPGHAAGGVKENNLGEKFAKAILLKSETTHGVVPGRGTGGSAVAVLADPICKPGGGICAKLLMVVSNIAKLNRIEMAENEDCFCWELDLIFTTTSKNGKRRNPMWGNGGPSSEWSPKNKQFTAQQIPMQIVQPSN